MKTSYRRAATAVVAVLCCGLGTLCVASATTDEPIQPVPQSLRQDPARASLGRRLFNDPKLSVNGRISCASCHILDKGGADGRPHSPGLDGQVTAVNTPTVFNAAFNFKQFWNGAANTLEEQIDRVIQSPVEMGSKWPDVVAKLAADDGYPRSFAGSYPDGITKANIQDAIASYERTLITPNARFDRYLRGETGAISSAEKDGYVKFKQYGCTACHQGVNVGGNMFQKFGVMDDYLQRRVTPANADLGRFLVTGVERDKYFFKVPSLRNVEKTAPYFHDGSAKTLQEAVDVMFRFQLGRNAPVEDRAAIVLFLRTLSAEPVAP